MTKVMDLFILSGWKAMFKISLAIIKEVKEKAMKVEDDKIIDLIRKYPKYIIEEKILFESLEFKISNRLIAELAVILTEQKDCRHLSIIYDLQSKKKKWSYENDLDSTLNTNGYVDKNKNKL